MTIVINQRTVHVTLLVAAVAVLGWLGWTRLAPGRTVIGAEQLVALDPDNAGINIVVTQPWLCETALVFDVRRPGERDYDRLDVTRCLMQCAQHLKNDSTVCRVFLARDGQRLYYIEGHDFRQLGEEYRHGDRWNNTMLATRIPTMTHTLADSLAFEHHGGLLAAVDNAQDWNTLMSHLLKHNSTSALDRIAQIVK